MIGERVETLLQIKVLADEGRAVTIGLHYKPRPAAFVFRMTGETIQKLITSGLYVYEPKTKTGE